jgi:hypothetical protein
MIDCLNSCRFARSRVFALLLPLAGCDPAGGSTDRITSPQFDQGASAVQIPFAGDSLRMAPPTNPVPSTKSCLTQAGPLVTLTGAQPRYRKASLPPNLKVDAAGARWDGAGDFPVLLGDSRVGGLCWSGGIIQGNWPERTPWLIYHSTAAMFMVSPGFTVEDVKVVNYGDAIRVEDHTNHWTIRRVHVREAHDDCIENDRLYSGLIDDALFQGCYVFLSERPGRAVGIPVDGRNETVRIQNSLVYLKPMPTVYSGRAPGTGPLFKWSNHGSMLTIENTIFRVDQKPNHGNLKFPAGLGSCANNTMVWLGRGAYPDTLPSCFTLTTDPGAWDRAVDRWQATHQPASSRP